MTESASVNPCQHHYIIDPPAGPYSTGTCKLCGATKRFKNSDENYDFKSPGANITGRYYSRKAAIASSELTGWFKL